MYSILVLLTQYHLPVNSRIPATTGNAHIRLWLHLTLSAFSFERFWQQCLHQLHLPTFQVPKRYEKSCAVHELLMVRSQNRLSPWANQGAHEQGHQKNVSNNGLHRDV